jgi:hypothetical protein
VTIRRIHVVRHQVRIYDWAQEAPEHDDDDALDWLGQDEPAPAAHDHPEQEDLDR